MSERKIATEEAAWADYWERNWGWLEKLPSAVTGPSYEGVFKAGYQAALAAPPAWRDIAEAPKDGTPILATNADYAYTLQRCGVYYWEGGETEALSGKVLVEPGWMHQSDDDDDERVTYLTHFMPLPPPPEGRER